jgi:hypothetical protein
VLLRGGLYCLPDLFDNIYVRFYFIGMTMLIKCLDYRSTKGVPFSFCYNIRVYHTFKAQIFLVRDL